MSGRFSRMIYVGNLPIDIKESEVEDLFFKYGRILDIELKVPPRPPCYAFVEFESARDAEGAIRGRDGYNFDGCRLRVELAHGGIGSSSSDRGGGGGYAGGANTGRNGISSHSEYRVMVRGLPSSASWQDLKDHMQKAGDVCFAEVYRDGEGAYGLVNYTNYEDMKYAIRKLDDTEFANPGTRSYIRVKEYRRSPSRNRRGCSRCRSPKKSSRRSADRSVSKSRSPAPAKKPSSGMDKYYAPIRKTEYYIPLPEDSLREMCDAYYDPRDCFDGKRMTFFNMGDAYIDPRDCFADTDGTLISIRKVYLEFSADMAKLCLKCFNEKNGTNFALDEIVKVNKCFPGYYMTFKARDVGTGETRYFRGGGEPEPHSSEFKFLVLLCEIKDDGAVGLEIPPGHDNYYNRISPDSDADVPCSPAGV